MASPVSSKSWRCVIRKPVRSKPPRKCSYVMSAPQLQFSNEETLSISGELSFQTVPELVAGHADLFQDAGTLTLDLMAVDHHI